MKKRHSKKRHHKNPANLKECFFPKRGHEFCYLGDASYKIGRDGTVKGKGKCLRDFYLRVDRAARPRLLPRFVLRLALLLEESGSKRAGVFRRWCLGKNEIEWMGWRWERFRIRGKFNSRVERLAKEASREIEDASHAGWFV